MKKLNILLGLMWIAILPGFTCGPGVILGFRSQATKCDLAKLNEPTFTVDHDIEFKRVELSKSAGDQIASCGTATRFQVRRKGGDVLGNATFVVQDDKACTLFSGIHVIGRYDDDEIVEAPPVKELREAVRNVMKSVSQKPTITESEIPMEGWKDAVYFCKHGELEPIQKN